MKPDSAAFRSVPALLFAASLATAMLTGCGATKTLISPPSPMAGVSLEGEVHGGQQPVSGAQIELFAAGLASGLNANATALLQNPVFTDSTGYFSISGDYTCPTSGAELYLMALGGNPGLASGTNNPAIVLVAPLGQCGNLTANTHVILNEVTTVATAYALAGFIGNNEGIGSSSTNLAGLQNAFATFNNLADSGTGSALSITPAGHGISPQAEVNSLADILAACVNTANDNTVACNLLFLNAEDFAGDVPTDVFQAAVNIARNPTFPDGSLFALITGASPFQPALAATPADWSMAIVYYGGGLSYPSSLAIDGFGNVWVSSDPQYNNTLSELSPQGVPISPGPSGFNIGFTNVGPIAIDSNNNIWMPTASGDGPNGVSEFNNNGTVLSPPALANGGGYWAEGHLAFPQSIAVDSMNNIWIANQGGVMVELNSSGAIISGSSTAPGFGLPGYAISYDPNAQAAGMAIDQSNNVWIANDGTDSIVEMDSQGFILTSPSGLYGGGLDGMTFGPNYPFQVAVDPNGNVWTTNMNSGTVSEFSSNRTVVGGYLVGGNPVALFIDSSDSLWIAQPPYNEIEQLDGVDPVNGYLNLIDNPEVNGPAGMAVDPSGNLWVANFGSGFSGSVTELVGIATPTKAPLSAAMQTRGFLP